MSKQQATMPADVQWNFKMPPTKVAAFLSEFPWVRDFVTGPVTQAYVSRVCPRVLGIRVNVLVIGDLFTDRTVPADSIWLLDENGHLVIANIQHQYRRRKYFFFGEEVTTTWDDVVAGIVPPEVSIGEMLERLQYGARGVRYVLWYKSFGCEGASQGQLGAVILYKAPKGISLPDWIAQQIDAEAAEYHAAVAQIDAEAG